MSLRGDPGALASQLREEVSTCHVWDGTYVYKIRCCTILPPYVHMRKSFLRPALVYIFLLGEEAEYCSEIRRHTHIYPTHKRV